MNIYISMSGSEQPFLTEAKKFYDVENTNESVVAKFFVLCLTLPQLDMQKLKDMSQYNIETFAIFLKNSVLDLDKEEEELAPPIREVSTIVDNFLRVYNRYRGNTICVLSIFVNKIININNNCEGGIVSNESFIIPDACRDLDESALRSLINHYI